MTANIASSSMPFPVLAKLLISDPTAKSHIEAQFPRHPVPDLPTDHLADALVLAIEHPIPSIQPTLFYAAATSASFDTATLPAPLHDASNALYDHLISLFTPLLFTPPPTDHMSCTDPVAHHWMDLVISPALLDGGGGRPLETLQRMKEIKWEDVGVCDGCCNRLRGEWDDEMESVRKSVEEFLAKRQSHTSSKS